MTDKEIALVRDARPADVPRDPTVKARAWVRLHAEFATTDGVRSAGATRTVRRRRFGRRFGWGLAAGGVGAVGVAVAVVAAQAGGPVTERQPEVRTAAQTLELAAQAVEHQTALPRPRPTQWVYTLQMNAFALQDGDVVGPEAMLHGKVKVEEWWRFDGTRMAESIQNGKLYVKGIFGPSLRSRPGHVDPRFNGGYIGGPAIVNATPHKLYDYVAGLPSDPDALLARIRHDVKDRGKDVSTVGRIAEIFRDDHLIPPEKAAALYRAVARVPHVSIDPDAADYAGRRGIGVVFGKNRDGSPMLYMVLDRHTYRYLGDPDTAILSSAVVNAAGQRS